MKRRSGSPNRLPVIIDRKCKNALSSSFHQWATRRASSNLIYRCVQVEEPVLRDELGRTESNPGGVRSCTRYLVNRMSRCQRWLWRHAIQGLQVVTRRESDGRSGKHYKGSRASWERDIDRSVAHRALRAANELAGVNAQNHRKPFRQHPRSENLRDWCCADVAHSMQVGEIVLLFAPKIVGHSDANLIMITAKEVVADALSRADKRDISIMNVDDRAALLPVGMRPVIDGLNLRCKSENRPKSR